MELTQFIAIEPNSYSEKGFPVSIAWSLPDGQIKDVLVEPLEDWNPREGGPSSIDLEHLIQNGESVKDILGELNHDGNATTLYCLDLDLTDRLCRRLTEPLNAELAFELADVRECFPDLDSESFWQEKQLIEEFHALSPDQTFDQVKALLFLYHQHTGQEL